ncbi:MAG: hypothetical protein ACPGNP_14020, partial [Acidimicrobiales bacterium]
MSFGDEFEQLKATRRDVAEFKPPGGYPSGWQPGYSYDVGGGPIVSTPTVDDHPDWTKIFEHWGLDPDAWDVDPSTLKVNAWEMGYVDRETGESRVQVLRQYKANIIPLRPVLGTEELLDVEALRDYVLDAERTASFYEADENRTDASFVVLIGDTQMGKSDGDGSKGSVERIIASLERTIDRIGELRRSGRYNLDRCVIAFMGDLIEQCSGNYPGQTYMVDLNLRDQLKIMVSLIVRIIRELAVLFDDVIVLSVPGNHGENRQGRERITDLADNFDVLVVEVASQVIDANPDAFGHVRFVYPADESLTLTLEISGVVMGFAHGHGFGPPTGNIEGSVLKWWRGQME